MKKILRTISIIIIATTKLNSQNNDSLRYNLNDSLFYNLEEIEITVSNEIKYTKHNNTYEFDVAGTRFEQQNNLIQSLKLLPYVQIQNNQLKVANQKCVIEINNNVIELPNEELINLLNSIDPANVSKIQITANSYKYGDKSTVINIILKQKINQYKISVQSTNGTRYNYYNESSLNTLLVTNKVWNINTFHYNYLPYHYNGFLQKITSVENIYSNYIERNKDKNLFGFSQIKLALPKHLETIFNLYFNNTNNNNQSVSYNATQTIRQTLINTREYHYFGEGILKKEFKDSSNLTIGALFFQRETQQNLSQSVVTINDNQFIKTNAPFFRLKADVSIYKEKFNIHFGTKAYRIIITSNSIWNNLLNEKFNYAEYSLYSYFSFETYINKINFNFNLSHEYAQLSNQISTDYNQNVFKYLLNTPLININLNWNQNNEINHSISLNNLIIKPDYSNFNSISSISNQLYFSSGSQNMKPSTAYQINYAINYKNIFLSLNLNYIKNFISNTIEYNENQNQLVNTYKNFEKILSSDFTLSWNKEIVPNFLFIKLYNTFSYFKLFDKSYYLHSTSPINDFNFTVIFSLNKIQAALNYYLTSDYYDGIFYHKLAHYPNLTMSYKINNKIKLFFEINDPFKTNLANQYNTLLPHYYYQSRVYYDYKMFNIMIKFTFQSINFKKFEIENSTDDVKRFNK